MRANATAVVWAGFLGLAAWFLAPAWAGDPKVTALRGDLRDPDVQKRIQALQSLGREDNLPSFKSALAAAYDNDDRVRVQLERTLVGYRSLEVREWLEREGIRYPDKWVRFYCVHAYLQITGAAGLASLVATLDQTYPEVQALFLEQLAAASMSEAIKLDVVADGVASILKPGRSPRVWMAGVNLLQRANTPRAAETLLGALEERADWPPGALVPMMQGALARMRCAGLADRMKAGLAAAKSKGARLGALAALGASNEEAGLQALTGFLSSEQDPELRAGAISALARCELPGAVPALVGLATAKGSLPDALLAASALLERPSAVPAEAVEATLKDPATDARLRGLLADARRLAEAVARGENLDAPLEAPQSIAMRRALAWMVRNQEDDGHWATSKHNPHHGKHGFPALYGDDADDYMDVATTGWCVLALLADRSSAIGGPYSGVVQKALAWLIAHQKPNGMVKADREPTPPEGGSAEFATQAQNIWATNHLVAVLAMLEASFEAGRVHKENPANKTITPEEKKLDAAVALAIDAIGEKALEGEYQWFNPKVVNMPRIVLLAMVRYSFAKRSATLGMSVRDLNPTVNKYSLETLNKIAESATTIKVPFDRNGNYWFRSYANTAQAISSAVYMTPKSVGQTPIHDFIQQRMVLLHQHTPRWNPFYEITGATGHPPAGEPDAPSNSNSFYTRLDLAPAAWKDDVVNFEFWFHATNACFIVGEDDWWRWRDEAYPVLLANQTLVGPGYGSWEPEGPNERVLGRCMSSAWGSLIFSMTKREMNIHNVMWHRMVPRQGYVPKPKTGDQPGEKK